MKSDPIIRSHDEVFAIALLAELIADLPNEARALLHTP
jgi:hypothetical protein